jgi:diaminopimelate decarboxylase
MAGTMIESDSRNSIAESDSFLIPSRQFPERLSAEAMSATLSRAIAEGAIGNSDDAVIFYNLSRLDDMLGSLRTSFPPNALHTVAVKANPIVEVLRRILRAGYGAEVASIGELHLALAAGFPAEAIVFDSPVKTRAELEVALKLGIKINANSLGELDRINTLYSALGSRSQVGVRINPETGMGAIAATSVAVQRSKFGVSLRESRAALRRAFSEYPWLTGLHLHIGSQGTSREQLIDGVGAVYDFFVELRERVGIRFFNIGGGLPAKYKESDTPIHFSDYATLLRERCPALFAPEVVLVTEFGRALHASCGWVASKVEYVIEHDSGATLIVHVGADMFLRKAYHPDDWHHDISVCDSKGQLHTGPEREFSVAGPLCFAGDYLNRSVSLPVNVSEGDYIIVHDSGAYTFSMWSMYNSRQFPAVIGYDEADGSFHCLRPRQSLEQIVDFWSGGE